MKDRRWCRDEGRASCHPDDASRSGIEENQEGYDCDRYGPEADRCRADWLRPNHPHDRLVRNAHRQVQHAALSAQVRVKSRRTSQGQG